MTTLQHDTAPQHPLEDLLCFDLYAASRAITARYRPLLDELGLTYPQFLVLVLLARSDAALRVREIADAVRLDHGTLTPLLRRLEEAGLVTRTRSSADERVVEVALTAAGHDVATRFPDVQCAIQDALGLDLDGVRALQQTLRALRASVELSG